MGENVIFVTDFLIFCNNNIPFYDVKTMTSPQGVFKKKCIKSEILVLSIIFRDNNVFFFSKDDIMLRFTLSESSDITH